MSKARGQKGSSHWNWKGGWRVDSQGYVRIQMSEHPRAQKDGYLHEHILVAEQALGHTLPPKAVIHHVDENKANNAPNNLVICEGAAYHELLHIRLRALRASGNPDFLKCQFCKRWDHPKALILKKNKARGRLKTEGLIAEHRECRQAYGHYYTKHRDCPPKSSPEFLMVLKCIDTCRKRHRHREHFLKLKSDLYRILGAVGVKAGRSPLG